MQRNSIRQYHTTHAEWTAHAFVLVCLVGVTIAGCRTTPITNRRQVLNPLVSESREVEMGVTAYNEMLKEERPSANQRYAEMVERVGRRIAAVADKPDYQWEFKLIQSPQQNAFCLPGGKVAVYEGILPVCKNEAGLAVVMAHEIAHATARHGGERMAHDTLANAGKTVLAHLTQTAPEKTQQMIQTAYGAGSKYLGILPFSRKHESEADHIGLIYMAKAGYDPREAPLFWERFGHASEGQPAEFLSTHPSHGRRSSELEELLPEALRHYETAPQKIGRGEDL
ncbi:MAG: M48 family metallopeptidase [Planctomycetaceae bacterium]